jgi:hypothetical protein
MLLVHEHLVREMFREIKPRQDFPQAWRGPSKLSLITHHMGRPPLPRDVEASTVRSSQSDTVAAKVRAGVGRRGVVGLPTVTSWKGAAGQLEHLLAAPEHNGRTCKPQ